MNWAPEVVQAEMEYRIERALGTTYDGTTFEHLRAARRAHRSWWRRHRDQHSHHDEPEGTRAA